MGVSKNKKLQLFIFAPRLARSEPKQQDPRWQQNLSGVSAKGVLLRRNGTKTRGETDEHDHSKRRGTSFSRP